MSFAYLPTTQTTGGVLIAWRDSDVLGSDAFIDRFSVTVKLIFHSLNVSWWVTSVYGPQEDVDKFAFLDELWAIRLCCQGPRAIVGDFNLIYLTEYKNILNLNWRSMKRFRRFIDEHNLKDLRLHGRNFTWSNEREKPTLERLDPILDSFDWEEAFPNCFLQALSSSFSDHCPLLLSTSCDFSFKGQF